MAAISMAIFVRCTGSSHVPMSSVGQGHRGLAEPRARDQAEDGVAARRDRGRDGEHVVDEQRAAADDAEARAQQLGGDDVAAAARGEVLDDAGVRVGDDEDGERGAERQTTASDV